MHYEGPGPETDEIRRQVENWFNEEMLPAFMIAYNKRKDNKWPAIMAWHKSVIEAIASCKKNYEDKLNEAKHELAKQENEHPLWDHYQNQGNLLGNLTGFYNMYKSELKKS